MTAHKTSLFLVAILRLVHSILQVQVAYNIVGSDSANRALPSLNGGLGDH